MNMCSLEMEINFHMEPFKALAGEWYISVCVCVCVFVCLCLHVWMWTCAQMISFCVLVSLCVGFYVLILCTEIEQVDVCLLVSACGFVCACVFVCVGGCLWRRSRLHLSANQQAWKSNLPGETASCTSSVMDGHYQRFISDRPLQTHTRTHTHTHTPYLSMTTCMNEHTQPTVTETDRHYYHGVCVEGDKGREWNSLRCLTLMQMLTAVTILLCWWYLPIPVCPPCCYYPYPPICILANG